MGWHHYLSFKTIGTNYEALKAFIAANFAAALLIYILVYVAVVALSLPGGLVMTVTGGLLFGWLVGRAGDGRRRHRRRDAHLSHRQVLARARRSPPRPVPWLGKLRDGFKENALSYLLFLRLVPVFPFWLVNLAPALLGVPLRTYVIGTAIGIIPGTIAFSVAGRRASAAWSRRKTQIYAACLAKAAGRPGDRLSLHDRHERACHQGAARCLRPARSRRSDPGHLQEVEPTQCKQLARKQPRREAPREPRARRSPPTSASSARAPAACRWRRPRPRSGARSC